jgi:hypothetical protein
MELLPTPLLVPAIQKTAVGKPARSLGASMASYRFATDLWRL